MKTDKRLDEAIHAVAKPPHVYYVSGQIDRHCCDKCGSRKTLPPARTPEAAA